MKPTLVFVLGLLATVTLVLGTLSTGINTLGQTVRAGSSDDCRILCENGYFDFEPPAPGGTGGGLGSDIINEAQDRLNSVADHLSQKFDEINQRLA
jgi:hypothetical protein